jgi:hypothetical protein
MKNREEFIKRAYGAKPYNGGFVMADTGPNIRLINRLGLTRYGDMSDDAAPTYRGTCEDGTEITVMFVFNVDEFIKAGKVVRWYD